MDEAGRRAVDEVPGWVAFLGRPDVWVGGLALAVFLILYWLLRGEPVGQPASEPSGEDAPSGGRRDRLVAMSAGGAVLVVVGACVAFRSIPWSLPAFAAAYALLGLSGRGARPYRHDSPILRRVSRFSETIMTGSLLAGVLAVANIAAFRYGERPIDLTRERVHTLEPETISQIRGLDRPVRFTAFYYGRLPQAAKQIGRVRQLLSLIEAENPEKVSVDFVDFQGDPARAEVLVERVPAAAVATGGVLIELGEGETAERMVVRDSEMFPNASSALSPEGQPLTTEFLGEYAITTALMRMRLGDRPKVAFTTGHGESPPDEIDVRSRGAGLLRARLADVGFDVSTVDLSRQDVPEGAALVLAAGPPSPFTKEEAGRLQSYLAGGGRALLLLGGREPNGLEDLLRSFNIEIGDALVVEPTGRLGVPSVTVTARIPEGATHPILRPLVGQAVAIPAASPITILDSSKGGTTPVNPSVAASPILRTGPMAWGETKSDAAQVGFDPDLDIPGPITVGVAVAEATRPGGPPDLERPRLIVFSSPDLADNRFARFVGYETNLDLAVNAANWLRGRLDLPEIAPRTRRIPRLDPDPNVQIRLILLPTLMSLSIILGVGTAVFLARRS